MLEVLRTPQGAQHFFFSFLQNDSAGKSKWNRYPYGTTEKKAVPFCV